jgi:PAS domain S-box-containing protein
MSQQVFLSHDSRDGKLAKVVAETVSRVSLKQIEMWYSSDSSSFGGLKPGQVWINEIKEQMLVSRAILILLTPHSLYRPWMYFESGFGFHNQNCQVIPLCVGISRLAVPNPLAIFQCYELNDYELLTQFCRKLFSQFQVSFDEEMALPILRTASSTIKSLTPEAVADMHELGEERCNAIGKVEICLAMLQKTFDDLPMMAHSIDETGVICEVNRKWLEVLGYCREEVIGKPADFLMTTASAELAMLVIIPNFWERGFVQDVPYQYKKKDGSIIDVLLNCVATTDKNGKRRSISFVQEVSTHRNLQNRRRAAKAKYCQMLQDESAGFYETDIFGNFTAVNNCMSRLLGFANKEELVGKNFREVIDSEAAKGIFRAHHSVFIDRVPKRGNVWKIHTKDNRTISVQTTVSLVTTPSGKAIGFRGVVRNSQD